jgi:excisionase family DNA binding protein
MHKEAKEALALTPREGADVIGVGRNKMRELLESGEIPSVRLGPRTVRIPLSALRDWLSRRAGSPAA